MARPKNASSKQELRYQQKAESKARQEQFEAETAKKRAEAQAAMHRASADEARDKYYNKKKEQLEHNKVVERVSGATDIVKGLSGITDAWVKNVSPLVSITSGDFTSFSAPQKATMIMKISDVIDLPIYKQTIGRPCLQGYELNDLVGQGFTVIEAVHIEYIDTATIKEIEAIESALKNGVLL